MDLFTDSVNMQTRFHSELKPRIDVIKFKYLPFRLRREISANEELLNSNFIFIPFSY